MKKIPRNEQDPFSSLINIVREYLNSNASNSIEEIREGLANEGISLEEIDGSNILNFKNSTFKETVKLHEGNIPGNTPGDVSKGWPVANTKVFKFTNCTFEKGITSSNNSNNSKQFTILGKGNTFKTYIGSPESLIGIKEKNFFNKNKFLVNEYGTKIDIYINSLSDLEINTRDDIEMFKIDSRTNTSRNEKKLEIIKSKIKTLNIESYYPAKLIIKNNTEVDELILKTTDTFNYIKNNKLNHLHIIHSPDDNLKLFLENNTINYIHRDMLNWDKYPRAFDFSNSNRIKATNNRDNKAKEGYTNNLTDVRYFFRNLRKLAEQDRDIINALIFKGKELAYHKKSLSYRNPEDIEPKILLSVNHFLGSGISWLEPLAWMFLLNIIFFLFFLSPSWELENLRQSWEIILELMFPFLELFSLGKIEVYRFENIYQPLNGVRILITLVLNYYLIIALRRYSRS